ncbi:hypothetical protein DdX_18914 [Ditylenchus destructor]|uniref:Uncharacterized protein n=1 Tax=Ditylenchus destructor TaxID=166010 RepID=A0AAD4QUI6_9BILA|nr:hypothetical protein DdX_18914 [Ditylenchus destructor]
MPIIDLWRVSYLFYSANTFGLFNLGSIIPNEPVNPTVTVLYEWLNRIYLVFMGMLPSSVFFLTFERCIGVQFPTKFTSKLRNRIAAFDLVCSPAASTVIYVFCPQLIWPFKMTVGILNTCACSFLIWKVKGRKKTPGIIIAKNTSLMELCLEFLPNLLLFLVLRLELTNANMYTSSLPTVGQCLNAVTCGILCNIRYSAKKNKVTPVTVSMSVKLNYPSEIRKANAVKNQKF